MEESGKRIVKELTGRDVPVILDPTMVITRKQWDEAVPDQAVTDGEYLFCYFLGNNPSHREEASALAKSLGLKIVTLRHLDEYIASDEKFGDEAPYDVGPEEFVNLIRHAKYVCTDSFHGSVFSILYRKQFISFNRREYRHRQEIPWRPERRDPKRDRLRCGRQQAGGAPYEI